MYIINDEKYNTMLEALADQRVFGIGVEEDNKFTIQEGCDNYFEVELTKEQLILLGQEIIDLANHQVARP